MDQKDIKRAVAKIHGRCWADPAFRERLKQDPHGVLREHGLNAPDGLKIHVHESSASEAHWVIPPRPRKLEGASGTSADYCSAAPDYCSDDPGDFCSEGPDYCSDSDECAAPAHPDICSA